MREDLQKLIEEARSKLQDSRVQYTAPPSDGSFARTSQQTKSSNTKNQKSMSKDLQEKVAKFMIKEVKEDLMEQVASHKIKLDDKNIAKTEHSPETLKIIVPVVMNKLQAAHNLIKQFEEEETYRTYNREYKNFFINDFMVAIQKLIPMYFGMLHVSKFNTDGKPANQDYVQIPIEYREDGTLRTEKGYVGSIIAPVWQDAVLDIFQSGYIRVRAKMKFEKDVNAFLEDVENQIRASSVVVGRSVSIQDTGNGVMATPIRAKENKKIVLSDDVTRIINNLVIPGFKEARKTSLLFTGDFGTGKTETALKVGIAAQRRYGRTFFYLHNSEMFSLLIPYLKNYQPAIVFVEDVDQISAGDRDSAMNNLLNQLDGNELKNINCTFIFTTNNHDKIHPAMRRPGRIDQVVHFDYCSVDMIAKIFELWAEGLPGADQVDYLAAAKDCPVNLQGAVVAEISRRALQYAEHLHEGVISTDRFLDAIASMRHHIEFMRADQHKDHTAEELLGHLLFKGMRRAFPNLGTKEFAVHSGSPIMEFADSKFEGLDN